MKRAIRYVAKAFDLKECYLDNSPLPVVAIFDDGSVQPTHLVGYIVSMRQGEQPKQHFITISSPNTKEIEIIAI